MAPNALYGTTPRRPASSLSSSSLSSGSSYYRPDFATPAADDTRDYEWKRSERRQNPLDYSESVGEMDRQLEKIRKSPSKIINEKNKFIAIIDMSNFRPEDIQVILEQGRLTIKAEQVVPLDNNTSVTKYFVRKFSIPEDVRCEMIATELSRDGMLKITALRSSC